MPSSKGSVSYRHQTGS